MPRKSVLLSAALSAKVLTGCSSPDPGLEHEIGSCNEYPEHVTEYETTIPDASIMLLNMGFFDNVTDTTSEERGDTVDTIGEAVCSGDDGTIFFTNGGKALQLEVYPERAIIDGIAGELLEEFRSLVGRDD